MAATSILVYHVYLYGAPDAQPVSLGQLGKGFENLRAGVTLFFVLSGFLLYRVFVGALVRSGGSPGIRSYFRNRLLRIVPAYWVILVGVVLVFEHGVITEPLQLLTNLMFLQNYVPAYMGTSGNAIIAPAWSLVIEMSFYVALPALGLLAVWSRRRNASVEVAVLVPVALMFVLGFASKLIARGMEAGSDGRWIFEHTLLTHADWFAAGMAVAVASVFWEQGRLRLPRGWRLGAVGAAVVLALGAMKLFYGGTLNGLEYQTPIAVACALLLAAVALSPRESLVLRSLSVRPMVFAGLVSYSLFLVHDPLVRGLRDWGLTFDGRGGFLVNLVLFSLLSFVLATAAYLYVERPALARKRRWQAGDVAGLGSTAPPRAGAAEEGPTEALQTAVEARAGRSA